MTENLIVSPDRKTLGILMWLPVGGFALISMLLFRSSGFAGGHVFAIIGQVIFGIIIALYLSPRPETARIGEVFGGIIMITIFDASSLLITHAAVTPARPLIDAQLIAADHWMGYDWRFFIGFFAQHPTIAFVGILCYNTHFLQPYLLALVLVFTGHQRRFEKTVLIFVFAMMITVFIFALWPVGTPWGYENMTATQLAPYHFPKPRTVGWEADFFRIRAGMRVIPESFLAGLVSFPSFHCISALVFLWAAWPVRWLRWMLLPVDLMMIVGALFVGCHYFSDIVAGAAVTALSIILVSVVYNRLTTPATIAQTELQPVAARKSGLASA
jgi:membrane-associated phospholipid phosphatase